MKTLIKPQARLKIISLSHSTDLVEAKLINSKTRIEFKFYQKLFLIFLTLSTFLIFPESPQDSDALCKKYHSKEACLVW